MYPVAKVMADHWQSSEHGTSSKTHFHFGDHTSGGENGNAGPATSTAVTKDNKCPHWPHM